MPQRSTILRGGGKITYRGTSVYTKADITVLINSKSAPLNVSMFGKLTDSRDDVSVEIGFEPGGEVTAALIGLFLPFFDGTIWYPGRSIFDPVIDYPLTINSRDGRCFTAVNAACMSPASLIGAATKTLFGAVKFVGLRSNGMPWSQAGSLFTNVPQDYPGDADFVRTNILRQPLLGRWLSGALPSGNATASVASPAVFTSAAHGLIAGDSVTTAGFTNAALNGAKVVATVTTNTFTLTGVNNTVATDAGTFTRTNVGDSFANFTTQDGWTIEPGITLVPDRTDDGGIIDMLYPESGANVKISAIPVGPSLDDVLAAIKVQGGGAARGSDAADNALPLYLNGAGVYVKVPLAALADPQNILWSPTKKRLGKITWTSEQAFVANAPASLLQVSVNPIA